MTHTEGYHGDCTSSPPAKCSEPWGGHRGNSRSGSLAGRWVPTGSTASPGDGQKCGLRRLPALLVWDLRFNGLPGNQGAREGLGRARGSRAQVPGPSGVTAVGTMRCWLSSQTLRLSVSEPGPQFAHPQDGVMKAPSPGWVELSANSGSTVPSAQPPEDGWMGGSFCFQGSRPGGETPTPRQAQRWGPWSSLGGALTAGRWVRARRSHSHAQELARGVCAEGSKARPLSICPPGQSTMTWASRSSSSPPPRLSSGSPSSVSPCSCGASPTPTPSPSPALIDQSINQSIG